jgi:hypothetical protein
MSAIEYLTGLDVGQMQDYTAVAVLERTRKPVAEESEQTLKRYAVRHLQRFPPGTPVWRGRGSLGLPFRQSALGEHDTDSRHHRRWEACPAIASVQRVAMEDTHRVKN